MFKAQFNPQTRSMDILKDGEIVESGVALMDVPRRLSALRFEAAKNAPADDRKPLYFRMDGEPVYKRPRGRR